MNITKIINYLESAQKRNHIYWWVDVWDNDVYIVSDMFAFKIKQYHKYDSLVEFLKNNAIYNGKPEGLYPVFTMPYNETFDLYDYKLIDSKIINENEYKLSNKEIYYENKNDKYKAISKMYYNKAIQLFGKKAIQEIHGMSGYTGYHYFLNLISDDGSLLVTPMLFVRDDKEDENIN